MFNAKSVAIEPEMSIITWPKVRQEAFALGSTEVIDWGIKLIGVPEFWRQTKGEGINVLVLDTGVAYNHTDLKDAIKGAKDFTNSPSGPMDVHGHGTHVCGTIAARENSTGVIGAAPKCNLYVGKVLGDDGKGTDRMVSNGLRWALQLKAEGVQIHVISMSLGSPTPSPLIREAIKEVTAAGIFVIAAAGNEGPRLDTMGYPGKWPEVISVGAINQRTKVTDFSSRSAPDDKILDIMAPGDQILSTWPPNTLQKLSGTSMACPLVTGVVVLMLSKHLQFGSGSPIKTVKDLRDHLRKCAIDLGPKGWDPDYGAGLINPAKILEIVGNTNPPAPTPSPFKPIEPAPILDPNPNLELNTGDLSVSGYQKLKSFMGEKTAMELLNAKGEKITIKL